MKQAKIALTAIAVVAVVGGALAFKAQRSADPLQLYTQTVVGNQTVCTVPTSTSFYTTNLASGGATATFRASLAPTNIPCPIITLAQDL